MDRFLKKKRGIEESDSESEQKLSTTLVSLGSEDHPLSLSLVCGYKMANELLRSSKLNQHLKLYTLQAESVSFFKRLSEQQTKAANCFKSIMTVSDKAQIASYQLSELIAKNMKAHTLGESLILPACKKMVMTMLGNEATMKISKIPLSNDTAHRRIIEMSSDIEIME
ncbi:zinc finger BED domain-containing protein 5-like [Centruroides vittatus]|uniref:zinc finger BED domain-containing protein 5-like n=1 Tax=Centruroides vittatus TaxID=120091 RepID=UPI00350EEACB